MSQVISGVKSSMISAELGFTRDGKTRFLPIKSLKAEICCQLCNRAFCILRQFGCQHMFCLSCCKILEFQCSVCKQHLVHSNYIYTDVDAYLEQNCLKLLNLETKQVYDTLKAMSDDVTSIEECQTCKQQYQKFQGHVCLNGDPHAMIKKYIPNIGANILLNNLNETLLDMAQSQKQDYSYFGNDVDDLQVMLDSVKLNAIAFLRTFNHPIFMENHHLYKMQFQRLRTLSTLGPHFKYDQFISQMVIDTIIHFLQLTPDNSEGQELYLILNNPSFEISAVQLLHISQLVLNKKIQLKWVFMLQFSLIDDPFIIEELGIKLFHQSAIMVDIHNTEYVKHIYALIARKVFSNVYHLGYPNIEQFASYRNINKENPLYHYLYNTKRMYNDFADNQEDIDNNINMNMYQIPYQWQVLYSLQSIGGFKENQIISIFNYNGYIYEIFVNKLMMLQNGSINVKNQDFKTQVYDIICVLYAILRYRASSQLNQLVLKQFKKINIHLIDQDTQQLNNFKYKDEFFSLLSAFITVLEKNKLGSFSLDNEISKMIIPPQNFQFLQSIIRLGLTLYIFQPKSLHKNQQFSLILPNFSTSLQTHYQDNYVNNNRYQIDTINVNAQISKPKEQNVIKLPSAEILCANDNFDENSLFTTEKFEHFIKQSQQNERIYGYFPQSISSTILPVRTTMALMTMLTQQDPVLFLQLIYFTNYQHLNNDELKIITQNYIESELQKSLQQSNLVNSQFTATQFNTTQCSHQNEHYYSQLQTRGIYILDFDYYQNYMFYQYEQRFSLRKRLLSFSLTKSTIEQENDSESYLLNNFQNFYFYTGDLVQFAECLQYYEQSCVFIYNFPCYLQSIVDCGTQLTRFFNGVQQLKNCITNSPFLHLINQTCQQFGFMHVNTVIPYNQALYQKFILHQEKNTFFYNTEQFYYCIDQLAHINNYNSFQFLINQQEFVQNSYTDLFDKISNDVRNIHQTYINLTQVQIINSDLIFINTTTDEQTSIILYFLEHFCKIESDSITLHQFIDDLSYTTINISNYMVSDFIEIFISKLINQYNVFKKNIANEQQSENTEVSLSTINSQQIYMTKPKLLEQLFNKMLVNEKEQNSLFMKLKIVVFNIHTESNDDILLKMQNLYNIVQFRQIQIETNKHEETYSQDNQSHNNDKTMNNIYVSNVKKYMDFCLQNKIKQIIGPIEFKTIQSILDIVNEVSTDLDYVCPMYFDYYEDVFKSNQLQFNTVKSVTFRNIPGQQQLTVEYLIAFLTKLSIYLLNVQTVAFAQLGIEYCEQSVATICTQLQQFKELKTLLIDGDSNTLEQFVANKTSFQIRQPGYREINGTIVKDYRQ